MILLRQISTGLAVSEAFVRAMARKADHAYKTYTVPKRGRGTRTVHHPARELKAIQRFLLDQVILRWPLHRAATAYRKGQGIHENAARHAASRYLLRMDLKDFFPSITVEDVKVYLNGAPSGVQDWDDQDRELFVRLVSRQGRLTIGAPSSPGLSNTMCFEIDTALDGLARASDVAYTRYADDLFFSCRTKGVLGNIEQSVINVIAAASIPANLKINPEKTRHLSKRRRRTVTGLVLTADGGVSVGRNRKRFIRRQIHRYDMLNASERRVLAGMLAFQRSIEPDYINALIIKYGRSRMMDAMKYE